MYSELIRSTIPDFPIRIDITEKPERKAGILSEMHLHDEIELVYVDEGRIDIIVDSKRYTAYKGTTFFINSRIPHSTIAVTDNTTGTLVQMRVEDFFDKSIRDISKYLPRFANAGDTPIILFSDNEEISYHIRHVMREYQARKPAYEVYVVADVYNMLAFLYRRRVLIDAAAYYDTRSVMKVLPILEYINENYNKNLTLEDISERFELNPSYFSRMFKKAIGSGYTEYLNFVRVCKSEKLLKTTDMSILNVALEVGFSSVSYFNRVFKKIKNCTPTTYKNARYYKM